MQDEISMQVCMLNWQKKNKNKPIAKDEQYKEIRRLYSENKGLERASMEMFKDLSGENERLRTENAQLKKELADVKKSKSDQHDTI